MTGKGMCDSRKCEMMQRRDAIVGNSQVADDEAMVGHPEIKRGDGPIEKFTFDWKKHEIRKPGSYGNGPATPVTRKRPKS